MFIQPSDKNLSNPVIENMWNYYLIIESDMKHALRFVEPMGQEEVYSYEFGRLLMLACSEIENVVKAIAYRIDPDKKPGNIGEYKEVLLSRFPSIISLSVSAAGQDIIPFKEWADGKLEWWDAYAGLKHNRVDCYKSGNYKNAIHALGALYLLLLYIAELDNYSIHSDESVLIKSDYGNSIIYYAPIKRLPDL